MCSAAQSEILLRRSCHSTSEDWARHGLIDLIERIHDALQPGFVDLANMLVLLVARQWFYQHTSSMNCLTASSVCGAVGLLASRVLCLAVEGRDGGDV